MVDIPLEARNLTYANTPSMPERSKKSSNPFMDDAFIVTPPRNIRAPPRSHKVKQDYRLLRDFINYDELAFIASKGSFVALEDKYPHVYTRDKPGPSPQLSWVINQQRFELNPRTSRIVQLFDVEGVKFEVDILFEGWTFTSLSRSTTKVVVRDQQGHRIHLLPANIVSGYPHDEQALVENPELNLDTAE